MSAQTTSAAWDLSRFEKTDAGLQGKCPSCDAYLHAYCASCFGCGYERGSSFADLEDQQWTVADAPLEVLLGGDGFLAKSAAKNRLAAGADEAGLRRDLWALNRQAYGLTDQDHAKLGPGSWKYNYLGGLESHPHPEHVHFTLREGRLLIDSEKSRERIASILPSRILCLSAHGTYDELLGGRTFGFISGSVAVFQSMRPTPGGLIKIVYADEQGIWRLVALGNRTGLTDKQGRRDLYQSVVNMLGF